jgi:hypothetical protein
MFKNIPGLDTFGTQSINEGKVRRITGPENPEGE